MSQPTYFPHAFNVDRAARIRREVMIPVTAVGSIMDMEMADRIIGEGKADMVAMGRAHVADPDLVNKTLRKGQGRVRPCVRCNTCGEKAQYFIPVRCAINPVIGREGEYRYLRPPQETKKIVVIGGGPAGMEAAIVAASRGHRVVLFERERDLGGLLRLAAYPPFKADMRRYLDFLIEETGRSRADVRTSTEATPAVVAAEEPDAIVVALGGRVVTPDIPGSTAPNAVTIKDVYQTAPLEADEVVVVGAGMTGCECALYLAQQGKRVTLIDRIAEAAFAGDGSFVGRMALMELLAGRNVRLLPEVVLLAVTDGGALVRDIHGQESEIPAGRVVVALGITGQLEAIEPYLRLATEVHVVGDCGRPGNLMAAVHSAFTVAAEV